MITRFRSLKESLQGVLEKNISTKQMTEQYIMAVRAKFPIFTNVSISNEIFIYGKNSERRKKKGGGGGGVEGECIRDMGNAVFRNIDEDDNLRHSTRTIHSFDINRKAVTRNIICNKRFSDSLFFR